MKPAPFAYAKARSVEDAVKLLGEHGDGAKLLAGGQSLMATLNMRLSQPSHPDRPQRHSRARRHRAQRRRCRDRRHGAPRGRGEIRRHRQTRAADRDGPAAYRTSGDPQSRHHRRLHRLCRSGGRTAGLLSRAGRRSRDRRASRHAQGEGGRFLQGAVRNRDRPGRHADRDPHPGRDARTCATALPNCRAGTATMRWSGSRPVRAPTADR